MLFAVALGRSHISQRAAGQWLSLVLFTGILYGAFIAYNRALFQTPAFWFLVVVLLSAHIAVFVILNRSMDQWRPIWNAVMFLEVPILDLLKGQFVHRRRGRNT
jgi:hypothetical protein